MNALAALLAASSAPIWHARNLSTNFAYLRSPPFVLPQPVAAYSTLPIYFTAERSPQVAAQGTTQSKLFNALTLYVNGVPTTAGPGHATLDASQPVRELDLAGLGLLRDPPAVNVLALLCSYFNAWENRTDAASLPRAQALLASTLPTNSTPVPLLGTDGAWQALDAGAFHRPAGDVNSKSGPHAWYHMAQENLDATRRPLGWEAVDSAPPQPLPWSPAALQPPFALPLASEPAPPPALLSRRACTITSLPSGSLLLDYGQEFLGAPNLTFAPRPAGSPPVTFRVLLGEELTAPPAPRGVLAPSRSFVNYTMLWTLPGDANGALVGLHAAEFIQFRYVELGAGAPPLAPGGAGASVMTAPRGGAGENPYELPCAHSTPLTPRRAPPAPRQHARFASSLPALDAVFTLCAYTAVAVALDINVDSQTRQRDLCHVDAFITNAAQYAIFPAQDASVQARTARAAFQLSSTILPATIDFKASTVLMAGLQLSEAGDVALWRSVWAQSDAAVMADGGGGVVSAQLLSGVRYFDAALGLLRIPANCSSGGAWGCDALIDWPVQTRDNYTVSEVDTLRNSYGGAALGALSAGAAALGEAQAAARYAAMAAAIAQQLGLRMLRWNGSSSSGEAEAYFVDGEGPGPASRHAAIHSTVYALAMGGVLQAWEGEGGGGRQANISTATLAAALTRYMQRRGGYGPASCMTAKVVIEALYVLGEYEEAAADFALELLSRAEYPGWGAMLAVGATTTLEAWLPGDKCACFCFFWGGGGRSPKP